MLGSQISARAERRKITIFAVLGGLALLPFLAYGQSNAFYFASPWRISTPVTSRPAPMSPYYGFDTRYGLTTNRFMLLPYVWLARLDGSLAVNRDANSPKVDLNEVFSNLDPALSLHFEGRSGNYSFWLDGMYLDLSSDPLVSGASKITVGFEYLITELIVAYRVGDARTGFEPFIGGRYTNLNASITSQPPQPFGVSGREEWFDPILGARVTSNLTSRLLGVVRADFGGFGVGSDFTWGVTAGLGYRLSDLIVLTGAYRLLDVKYESTKSNDSFIYDAQQRGMLWGVGFLF